MSLGVMEWLFDFLIKTDLGLSFVVAFAAAVPRLTYFRSKDNIFFCVGYCHVLGVSRDK
jgi:hypothetical protein